MKKTFFAVLMNALLAFVTMAQTSVNYNVSYSNFAGDKAVTWTPTLDSAGTEWSDAFELGGAYNVGGGSDLIVSLTQTAGDSNNVDIYLYKCYGDPTVTTNWILVDTLYAAAINTTTPSVVIGGTNFVMSYAPYYKFKAYCDAETELTFRIDLYAIKQVMFY